MTIQIRTFTPNDYEAAVAIGNVVYSEYIDTVEEWQLADKNRDAQLCHQRFLAEVDGQVVGLGSHGQNSWMYDPQKFRVNVMVLPEFRQRGLGSALYERVLQNLAQYNPILLRSRVREDFSAGMAFIAKQGYVEEERDWESRLYPAGFDHTPYAGKEEKVLAQGIEITTLAHLMQTDPEHARKLYDLDWDSSQDQPAPEPLTQPSFEVYCKDTFEDPNFVPEAFWVAVANGHYVGVSNLYKSANPKEWYVGYTGVASTHRRRGIALALKLRTVKFAQEKGNVTLKTWNNSLNQPMLAINNRLGFVRQPAWISFKKEL